MYLQKDACYSLSFFLIVYFLQLWIKSYQINMHGLGILSNLFANTKTNVNMKFQKVQLNDINYV